MHVVLVLLAVAIRSFVTFVEASDEDAACPSSMFICSDGNCIRQSWVCDDENDCDDGSDESNCTTTCRSLQFRCRNGRCIPKILVCDGINDCRDYSDEYNCSGAMCPSSMFKCSNGKCIRQSWVCDDENDCDDGSDESNCTISCTSLQFRCENGRCIPKTLVCDSINHCRDYSDESNCGDTSCSNSSFLCENGKCIPTSWTCDGGNDCHDNSDEVNCVACQKSSFRCGNGRCIPEYWKCDGDTDCDDSSDEANCETSTTSSSTSDINSVLTLTTESVESYSLKEEASSSLTTEEVKPFISTIGLPNCVADYCQNGGQCELVGMIRICRCSVGYKGGRCQTSLEYNGGNPRESRNIAISISVVALIFSIMSMTVWLFRKRIFRANISARARKFVVYFQQSRYSNRNRILSDSDDVMDDIERDSWKEDQD